MIPGQLIPPSHTKEDREAYRAVLGELFWSIGWAYALLSGFLVLLDMPFPMPLWLGKLFLRLGVSPATAVDYAFWMVGACAPAPLVRHFWHHHGTHMTDLTLFGGETPYRFTLAVLLVVSVPFYVYWCLSQIPLAERISEPVEMGLMLTGGIYLLWKGKIHLPRWILRKHNLT